MVPLLTLEGVHKTYPLDGAEVPAINGISLTINTGEFIAVIGPSGSGKSTAMNLIGCLDTATTGRILLEKQNIQQLSESALANIRGRKIGFVFQTFNLIADALPKGAKEKAQAKSPAALGAGGLRQPAASLAEPALRRAAATSSNCPGFG